MSDYMVPVIAIGIGAIVGRNEQSSWYAIGMTLILIGYAVLRGALIGDMRHTIVMTILMAIGYFFGHWVVTRT